MNVRPDPLHDFVATLPKWVRPFVQLMIERVTVILAADRLWLIDLFQAAMILQDLYYFERMHELRNELAELRARMERGDDAT